MKISELQRKSETETWHVKAHRSTAKERGDMVAVLGYLYEESGEPSVKGLQEHFCLRRMMAERLLEYACLIGLVSERKNGKGKDRFYKLTGKGRKAVENEKVFIPEDGVWEMTFCRDPLLPHPVISVNKSKEPNAWNETNHANKEKTKKRQESFEDIPSWIKEIESLGEFTPPEGGEEMMIEFKDGRSERVGSEKSLNIRWNVHKKQVSLKHKGKDAGSFQGPKGIDRGTIWDEFLETEGKLDYWDEERKSLAVSFTDSEINDSERNSMKKTFRYKNPEISDYGKFDDVTIEGVPIHAETEEDAQKWAEWHLDQRITSLASRKKYDKWWAEASKPFSEYHLEPPERDARAEEIWQSSKNPEKRKKERKKAWYMVAAVDWNL